MFGHSWKMCSSVTIITAAGIHPIIKIMIHTIESFVSLNDDDDDAMRSKVGINEIKRNFRIQRIISDYIPDVLCLLLCCRELKESVQWLRANGCPYGQDAI